MISLDSNTFVRHFLLGNNMIGPVGARLISNSYLRTPIAWRHGILPVIPLILLALNAWSLRGQPSSITKIWLKRNPLGPKASTALYDLITKTSKLRTLDLDVTELGDEGVCQLFSLLENHHSPIPLRDIYLNAVGIGHSACKSLAKNLSSPNCKLESVYLDTNPMGDAGADALAGELASNTSLLRLTLASCGLNSKGANSILQALKGHNQLMTLRMGQSIATEDLGMRYIYLEDDVVDSVKIIVSTCQTLRMLDLGTTAMSLSALESLYEKISNSKTLVVFSAKSLYNKVAASVKLL